MTDAIGFGRALTANAAQQPAKVAVAMGDDRVTYGELEARANRLARELSERGVDTGRFVAIVLPNSIEYIELVFAVWKVGAVPLPLNPRLPERELRALIDLAEPVLVVGASGVPLEELRAAAASRDDSPLDDVENNPWKAIASGGSTGRPKLIVDGASSPTAIAMAGGLLGLRPDHVQLHATPLCHNGPFVMAFAHVTMGGTVILHPRFDAEQWLDTLERERVGWAYVVPTMLHRLFRLPDDLLEGRDLSALDVVFHTAGPCPPWLKRRAIDYFGAGKVVELYGATEAGAGGSTLIRGDEWLEHPGSVGRPIFPETVVRITDDDGRELPTGEVGHVWIKPFGGLNSRYRGAELSVVDEFLAVGDLGHVDADGYLYLDDRRTDMVVTGGINVYPAEVEAVLLEHPAVADAAVVGLPDDQWGQRVHAIVQLEEATEYELEEIWRVLEAHCREQLVGHKVPRSWEVVAALPRDPSGKIRRSELRDARIGAGA